MKSVYEQQNLAARVGALELSTVGVLFGTACNLPRPPRAEMKNYSAIFNTSLEHRKRTKIREKRRGRGSTCPAPLRSKYAGNYRASSVRRSEGNHLCSNHLGCYFLNKLSKRRLLTRRAMQMMLRFQEPLLTSKDPFA